mgnify:FL=1
MKAYLNQLPSLVSQKKARLFILSGDEPLLIQEASQLLRNILGNEGFSGRELFMIDGSFDWDSILFENNSFSFFAEKKLIEIRMSSKTPGDKGAKALQELFKNSDEDTAVILVIPKLEARVLKTKWFKDIETLSTLVQIWPVSEKDLPKWIADRIKRAGLDATTEAIAELSKRIEGNLLAASQEIERLKLTVDNRQITSDDIKESVSDNSRFDIFRLVDVVLKGDVSRSFRILEALRAEGVEPLFICNMLSRELKVLESIKFDTNLGKSLSKAVRDAGVWETRKNLVSNAVDRLELNSIRKMLLVTGDIDRVVKGEKIGDPWTSIQDIVLAFSGTKTCLTSL